MRQIVLLSGGLDSTTLLYDLVSEHGSKLVTAIFFDYGQKSVEKERQAVRKVTSELDVKVFEYDIKNIFKSSTSSILSHNKEPITIVKVTGSDTRYESNNTELEFRNGVMLASAISIAMQLYPLQRVNINYGAIKTRENYPDCTTQFVCVMDALAYSQTDGRIQVSAPYIHIGKDKVYILAKGYGVDLDATWSCYDGMDKPCGICPACLDRRILEAMYANK